jgi:hypothetical protein
MPLSSQVSIQNLKPGKKYAIEVQWNVTNNLRMPSTYMMIGTFVQSAYVRGRTQSFDTGLKVLLTRARYEVTFNINGLDRAVSSANKFYEVLVPEPSDFATVAGIYGLPLPTDLKKTICSYLDEVLVLKYRMPVSKPHKKAPK